MKNLVLDEVSFKIGNKIILNKIDFELKKGKFYSFLGPNGCGKTTLVRSIANDIECEGEILVFSKIRKSISQKDFSKDVSIMRQFSGISDLISVRELLEYSCQIEENILKNISNDNEKKIIKMASKLDIKEMLEMDFNLLSGGEKQRVILAMALIRKPKILILDEPTNHLDIKYTIDLLKIVKKFSKKYEMTVLCILHDLNLALKFSNRIFLMKQGKLVYKNLKPKYLSEEIIEEIYGVKVNIFELNDHVFIDYIV